MSKVNKPSQANKLPPLIHSTFDHAEVDPEPLHVAIYAEADRYNIRMIVWPDQVPALIAVLEHMQEQIQSEPPASQPSSVVWKPVITTEEKVV